MARPVSPFLPAHPHSARPLALAAGTLAVSALVAAAVQVERGARLLDGRHGHVLE